MGDYCIPIINLDMLTQPIVIDVFVEEIQPIEVTIGLTVPGPKGDTGPPAEIYYGVEEPDDDMGNDGAIYVKYVE